MRKLLLFILGITAAACHQKREVTGHWHHIGNNKIEFTFTINKDQTISADYTDLSYFPLKFINGRLKYT